MRILKEDLSSGTSSGSLTVVGGVGVGGNINCGSNVKILDVTPASVTTLTTTGALIITGGVVIENNLITKNNIYVSDATDATSSTSGALVVDGGVAINKELRLKDKIVTIATESITENWMFSGGLLVGGLCVCSRIGNSDATTITISVGEISYISGAGSAGIVTIDLSLHTNIIPAVSRCMLIRFEGTPVGGSNGTYVGYCEITTGGIINIYAGLTVTSQFDNNVAFKIHDFTLSYVK